MDQFQKPRFYVPIEIVIVIAINLVVGVAKTPLIIFAVAKLKIYS